HASRRTAARVGRGKHLRLRRAAMLLSMRASGPRVLAKRTQLSFWPNGSQASTNQQLYEMTAGLPSLFPACSLQGLVQLTRVARIERSKFCTAIRTHTWPWSRRHIRLVVHPSRAARRRRVELGCVGAPAARPSEPRRQIERRSSCDSRVQFDSYPRNLVTKARATGAMPTQLSRQVARRSSFACRGGRLASIAAANAKSYASGVT